MKKTMKALAIVLVAIVVFASIGMAVNNSDSKIVKTESVAKNDVTAVNVSNDIDNQVETKTEATAVENHDTDTDSSRAADTEVSQDVENNDSSSEEIAVVSDNNTDASSAVSDQNNSEVSDTDIIVVETDEQPLVDEDTATNMRRYSNDGSGIASSHKYASSSASTYYYSQLTSDEKTIYDSVLASTPASTSIVIKFATSFTATIVKNENGSYVKEARVMVQDALDAILKDHPDMDWLDITQSKYTCSMSYVGSVLKVSKITFKSIATVKTADQVTADMAIVNSITANGSDRYTKVKYIHDYVCNLLSYASNADYSDSDKFSVFGAVESHSVVCEGYAELFKLVCDNNGIPCVLVTSNTHMWDEVQMEDGSWYLVDCTWDDQSYSFVDYYFLIGSSSLSTMDSGSSHVINSDFSASGYKTFAVPQISASDYTYDSNAKQEAIDSIKANLSTLQISSITATANTVNVSWTDVAAKGYYVYRRSGSGNYTMVADQNGTSYSDSNVSENTEYTYMVQAYSEYEDTAIVSDGKEATVTTAAFEAPVITVSETSAVSMTLTWNTVYGNGYNLYRSEDGTNFSMIYSTNDYAVTSHEDVNLVPGTMYYYKLEATCVSSGTTTVKCSDFIVGITDTVSSPMLSCVSKSTGNVTTNWTKSNCNGYQVRISTDASDFSNASVANVNNQSTVTLDNSNLNANTTYYFEIVPFVIAENGQIYYGEGSNVVGLTA
jgi:hypothetical protein